MHFPPVPPLMWIQRRADAMIVRAPAKVNLFLEVLGKRTDGYHDIATLMVAVGLFDTLRFRANGAGEVRLRCDNPALAAGPENLVCRAAALLRRRTGCGRGAVIHLAKRIPLAAGLAGGSSDAAATLVGLNDLWDLGLGEGELAGLAAELGSDVPFFFATPAAWCTGRGERVERRPCRRPLDLVLVCPPAGLSTAAVYRAVEPARSAESGEAICRAVAEGDVADVGRRLHNRLQPAAERLCPAVAAVARRVEALGPLGCRMSGSGTTVFALCPNRRGAWRLARELRRGPDERLGVYVVRSCS